MKPSSSSSTCLVGKRVGRWKCVKQLGTGSFGIVHVWSNQEAEDDEIALKKCRFGPEVPISEKHREQWRQEVDIMLRLDHLNVVKCRRPPQDLLVLGDEQSDLPMLCMEFCAGGDLRKFLNRGRHCVGLDQDSVLNCVADVASALGFLHNRRIIHRDLKPENVVLDVKRDDRVVFKLIDLGYAKELGQSSLALSFVGTLQYIAPELFLSQEYTKSVDYWSLGFITFEIATGQRPFLPNLSPGQWMEHVAKKTRREICIFQDEMDEDQKIQKSEHIFPVNHLSKTLAADLESWLRLLLDWDAAKRGKNEDGKICLFDDLTALISKRRLKIHCMDSGHQRNLDYVLEDATTGLEMRAWIEKDVGVAAKSQLCLFTNGKRLASNARPIGDALFVFDAAYSKTNGAYRRRSWNKPRRRRRERRRWDARWTPTAFHW